MFERHKKMEGVVYNLKRISFHYPGGNLKIFQCKLYAAYYSPKPLSMAVKLDE
jgi:hypothetical protein